MRNIYVKTVIPECVRFELENIEFDKSYIGHAVCKNQYRTIKIIGLKPQEASILKQSALALGFDAAVSRGVLDCSVKSSDALLSGSLIQFEKLSAALEKQPFQLKKVAELIMNEINNSASVVKIGTLDIQPNKTYLMGILNVTPDSFSDGGLYDDVDAAVKRLRQLIEDGADIIDIGAESTRPNHTPVDSETEINRLKPILEELQGLKLSVPVSLDTRNVKTAEFALKCGVNCINDVSFAEYDKNMIDFINSNSVPYVLTHSLDVTTEKNVVEKVYKDLMAKLENLTAPVIVDVGIGFGKTKAQNFELIKRVSEFKSLKRPLLVGHSRKSFLSGLKDTDIATLGVSSKLMNEHVEILRVHDVKAHKALLDTYENLN